MNRHIAPSGLLAILVAATTAAALSPLTAPGSDIVDPLPQVVTEALPRIHGWNADYLDGYSSEDFFDAIQVEEAARMAADAALNAALDQESTDRAAADDALQAALDDESATRSAADAVLQAALDQEIEDRIVAYAALEADLEQEAFDRAAADGELMGAIADETAARSAADSSINAKIASISKMRIERFQGSIPSSGVEAVVASYVPQDGTAFMVTSYFMNANGGCFGGSGPSNTVGIRFHFNDGTSVVQRVTGGNCGSETISATTTGITRHVGTSQSTSFSLGPNTAFDNANGKTVQRVDFLVTQSTGATLTIEFSGFEV